MRKTEHRRAKAINSGGIFFSAKGEISGDGFPWWMDQQASLEIKFTIRSRYLAFILIRSD